MLRRLFEFLWGRPRTVPPRLRDLLERLDDLEGDVSGLRRRVKTVEGQISGGKRRHSEETAPQDAPQSPNGDEPEYSPPPLSTAHLAGRLRSLGR